MTLAVMHLPLARRHAGEALGLVASLVLHLLALVLILLAPPEARPPPEPQVVELVIERPAAAKAEPADVTPEEPPPPAAPPHATIDLPFPEPAPPFSLEAAPEPPRRKPAAPTLPAPAPAARDFQRSSPPTAAEPSPAAPRLSAPAVPTPEPPTSRYGAVLLAWLERYRDYPRAARLRHQQGEVVLRLTIERGGRLLAAEIAQSSGVAQLDQAALDTARRAAPMPPLPADEPGDRAVLLVPVLFALAKG